MKKNIKVIVFGNQKICIDCLGILRKKENVEIGLVVGCELAGDSKYGYPSVRNYCKDKKIRFLNPSVLNPSFLKTVKECKPDFCFSIYYRYIFKPEFIETAKRGFINFHPSLLPAYRGPVPTMWALIKGEEYTGMTIHYIDEGVDTGDIVAQKKIRIPKHITGFELNNKMMDVGVCLFEENIEKIFSGKNCRIPQPKGGASYFGKFLPSVRCVNWFDEGKLIERRIAALTRPYPGAISQISGKQAIFWDAHLLKEPLRHHGGPGRIAKVSVDGKNFIATTIDGYIRIIDYELVNVKKSAYKKHIVEGGRFDYFALDL